MPRLIILLLTLISLTILTVQNLGADKAVSLVVLGTPLSSIPIGLLLLSAVGIGALTTLAIYGLIGLRRPVAGSTKSKYKPMGSRVPYPESSDSTTIPPSGSAFVTEPPVDRVSTPASSSSTAPNPATPGNVYSPFSRESDPTGKKKRPTLE
ncbi:MAG: hypothetical protein DCF25_14170 [Leptolyngbya foveolarum]|uniref:DUF1049 domain-containing protein n=1 Tax=Leptolyngbya foveolarum TaxID=47253 RepID=A0A2W4VZ46_9CYAN|nr:MAG: hypothetical protein DCF25_14170 [Leptolyngbya foveolarum]